MTVPLQPVPQNKRTRLDSFARRFTRFIEDHDGFVASGSERFDSADGIAFARALDEVRARTFDIKYPELKRNILIPNTPIDPASETISYKQFDELGQAQPIHDYAKDFHNVDVKGKEFLGKVGAYGDSYQYSIQDLRAARRANFALEQKKATAARNAIERKLESVCAVGDSAFGLLGIANQTAVSVVTGAGQSLSGTDVTGSWDDPATTVQQILDDLNKASVKIHNDSLGIFQADTLILPTSVYGALATRQRSATFTDDTVLQYILNSSPWLKAIEFWPYLATAGASSKARAVLYKKDPEVLEQRVAVEFEQFAPQNVLMTLVVPCHARHGGVVCMYPKAMLYLDGLQKV